MSAWLDDYEPVAERLDRFWSGHPDGQVRTRLVELSAERVVFGCELWVAGVFVASGHALQVFLVEAPKSNQFDPEYTSPLETCETSAIGRALANAGYAAKKRRPSREEMHAATPARHLVQVGEALSALSDEQRETLRGWWRDKGFPPLARLSRDQASEILAETAVMSS